MPSHQYAHEHEALALVLQVSIDGLVLGSKFCGRRTAFNRRLALILSGPKLPWLPGTMKEVFSGDEGAPHELHSLVLPRPPPSLLDFGSADSPTSTVLTGTGLYSRYDP